MMKTYVCPFFLWLLFLPSVFAQIFPVNTLLDNGSQDKRINYVFLGDGYRESELSVFDEDVKGIMNALFDTTPFKEYKNFFNVYSIDVPSKDSGADHPGNATDVTEPAFPTSEVDTYFGSTFDFANIHRLLVPTNNSALASVLALNFPAFDQAFVVVNSPFYGGSGGFYATSSTDASAAEIAIHEIGHSFANLADEYWAGDNFANELANMTREADPDQVKWKNWVGVDDVGVFRHGTSGLQSQYYRPHQNCKMRFLGVDFCRVCKEAFVDRIYALVSPINDYLPQEDAVAVGESLEFSLDLIYPEPNSLKIQWLLNGEKVEGEEKNTLVLTNEMLESGTSLLVANVIDETPLSRSYLPESGYIFTQSWEVEKSETTNIESEIAGKFFYKAFPNPSKDLLTLSYANYTPARSLTLTVRDIQGKEILQESTELAQGESNFLLDLKQVASGIYLLEVKSEHFQQQVRIVKE